MDWARAKIQVLISLIILNILLLGLNFTFIDNYSLSTDQLNNIITVLENQNIAISTNIPKDYSPMSTLKLSPYAEADISALQDVFFENASEVTRTTDIGKVILSDSTGSLTLLSNKTTYNSGVIESGDMTIDDAENLCNEYLKKLPIDTENYILDLSRELVDRYLIEFREVYKGSVIQGNYISFLVSDGGIISVEYTSNAPLTLTKTERQICSPDEALLSTMLYINNTYGDTPCEILKVQIVYNQNSVTDELLEISATPYYCIYIDAQIEPILIDAYTNTLF